MGGRFSRDTLEIGYWISRLPFENRSKPSWRLGFNFGRLSSNSFERRLDSGSPQAPPGMTVLGGRRYDQNPVLAMRKAVQIDTSENGRPSNGLIETMP